MTAHSLLTRSVGNLCPSRRNRANPVMADHDIVRACSLSLYDTRAWPSIPPAHARGEAARLPLIVFSTRCQSGKTALEVFDFGIN